MNKSSNLTIFEGTNIRKIWHNDEWWFSIIDIVGVLTGSARPRKYWADLKNNLINEGFIEVSANIGQFKLPAPDGKLRNTDCANIETTFRIIQSIPSKKAEPFKRWLAKIGKERIDEIENPELAQERMKALYEQKGYPQDWIDKRLRGIAIRQNLTDEWKERGVTAQSDFAILTAEISKATFGMTPAEYKKLKSLDKKHNLRDHMTDFELIFTMLGEKISTEISKNEQPDDFYENKKVAKRGGKVAGKARKDTEKEIGKSIIEDENYLNLRKTKIIEGE